MTSNSAQYFLKSDRIGFRWWQSDDLPAAMSLWGNPEVTRLFHKEPLTQDQVSRRLQQELESAKQHQIQYWPIFRLDGDKFMGCAGLRSYSKDTLELGIHLKPEYWGGGLATEAGRRAIQHAFDDRRTEALFAGHHPENTGSRNVLLKLGFLGTSAKFYEPTGLFHPSYLLYRETQPYSTRPATPADARALAIVHYYSLQETFSSLLKDYAQARPIEYCIEQWERRLATNECTIVALTRGEQIVGFASVATSPDEDQKGMAGELSHIYIHPSAWGHGHGSGLMQWCEETVAKQNFKTIKLWVFAVNTRARSFYEKHGYKLDGGNKEAFGARLLRYSKNI